LTSDAPIIGIAMPTYEYACTDCAERVEVLQRISDPPLETCEVCGGALRKVFHPAGIVLKGSGFYKTDNRSSGNGAKKGSDPKTASSDSGSSSKDGSTTSGEGSSSPKEKSA
jgi:putative FmdB family regulatory protein